MSYQRNKTVLKKVGIHSFFGNYNWMDRNKLISYSLFYDGEYKSIIAGIRNDTYVPDVVVENAITIFDDI